MVKIFFFFEIEDRIREISSLLGCSLWKAENKVVWKFQRSQVNPSQVTKVMWVGLVLSQDRIFIVLSPFFFQEGFGEVVRLKWAREDRSICPEVSIQRLRLATSLSLISSWLSLMFISFFFRSVDEEKRLVHTSDVTVVINFIVDRVIPPHGNSRVWSYSLRQLFRHRSGLPSCL